MGNCEWSEAKHVRFGSFWGPFSTFFELHLILKWRCGCDRLIWENSENEKNTLLHSVLTLKWAVNSAVVRRFGGHSSSSLFTTFPFVRMDTRSSRLSFTRYSCNIQVTGSSVHVVSGAESHTKRLPGFTLQTLWCMPRDKECVGQQG